MGDSGFPQAMGPYPVEHGDWCKIEQDSLHVGALLRNQEVEFLERLLQLDKFPLERLTQVRQCENAQIRRLASRHFAKRARGAAAQGYQIAYHRNEIPTVRSFRCVVRLFRLWLCSFHGMRLETQCTDSTCLASVG